MDLNLFIANTADFLFNTASGRLIMIILVITITFTIERIVEIFLRTNIKRTSYILNMDHTQFIILKRFITSMIYVIGAAFTIYLIPALRNLSISLFAGAGVLAVIIGFASQKAIANLVSGLFIAMYKPFRVDDIIKFRENIGVVEDITLRHTVIRNFENKRFIVPNSTISDEVIENFNISEEKVCRYVDIRISYDSSIDKAMKIMQEEAIKHPDFLDTRTEEEKNNKEHPISVRVLGFGDSSVNLRAWVWTKDPKAAFRLGTDLNKSIKERFDKEGIEIPFPYRTIVYKEKERKKNISSKIQKINNKNKNKQKLKAKAVKNKNKQ
ncbi:MAG: mechanosensitive ion channel family protein [Candidatus Woesearchaeota archaeon]